MSPFVQYVCKNYSTYVTRDCPYFFGQNCQTPKVLQRSVKFCKTSLQCFDKRHAATCLIKSDLLVQGRTKRSTSTKANKSMLCAALLRNKLCNYMINNEGFIQNYCSPYCPSITPIENCYAQTTHVNCKGLKTSHNDSQLLACPVTTKTCQDYTMVTPPRSSQIRYTDTPIPDHYCIRIHQQTNKYQCHQLYYNVIALTDTRHTTSTDNGILYILDKTKPVVLQQWPLTIARLRTMLTATQVSRLDKTIRTIKNFAQMSGEQQVTSVIATWYNETTNYIARSCSICS